MDALAAIDLEYFFICLRAKSVSNISKIQVKDSDGEMYEVEVNLDKIVVERKNTEVSNNIKLTDTVGIILKYPTFKTLSRIEDATEVDSTLAILRGCIEQIYEGEEVFDTSNYSKQELDDFILSLNKNQIEEIQKFFESMPKLVYNAKYLTKDKVVKDLKIEGLENFF